MDDISRNPFLRRLGKLTGLEDAEIAAVAGVIGEPRTIKAGRLIAYEGDATDHVHLLVEGWAARTKLLVDGQRHFPLLLVPGDLCDIDGLHVRRLDYGVTALTDCRVAAIARADLVALVRRFPAIGDALTWFTFVENAIMAEALASHGRRSALGRLAHLLCELGARLGVVGMADEGGYQLPITQEALADATGLTSVHVNRTLQALRGAQAITLGSHRLDIRDWDKLRSAAGFQPGYLHLDGMRPQPADA